MIARLRWAVPRRGALAEAFLVVAGYVAVAVWATWPLARQPVGGFYGFGNDNLGGIWVYDALHDAYTGPSSTSRSPELQAPYGYDIPDHVLQPMDRLYSLLFGGFGDGLGAYNAQIFLSFVFAGCTMYLLARHLTGNRAAAWVAGFAYTASPWHLALAMQYNSLAAIEWIPLFVLALVVFLRTGRARHAAFVGVGFALVAATSYYYAWFVAWGAALTALFVVVRLAVAARRSGALHRRRVAAFIRMAVARVGVAVAVAVAILVPLLLPSFTASQDEQVAEQTSHPLSEAVRYSMRPWMLVLPPHDNPLFGDRVDDTVFANLFDAPVYEQSIFVGYAVLLLALIALLPLGARRLGRLGAPAAAARPVLIALAAVGLLMMLGPHVPLETSYWRNWSSVDDTAHLPSLGTLMREVTPTFRFFVRAFVLVSAALAALAAIGLTRVLERVPGTRARAALTAGAVLVIGAEFANAPPRVFTDTSPSPAWVQAVRGLPGDGPVIDYPVAALNSPRSLYYMFWQREHDRPTVNPPGSARAAALQEAAASPDDPAAGRALHNAGIAYAVVHTALPPLTTPPYQPALPGDALPADAGAGNPWFEEVRRTPDAVIYRVLGEPRTDTLPVVARLGAGYGGVENQGGRSARWLQASEGTIDLFVTAPGRFELRVALGSFARPRTTTVLLDGRTLPEVRVPPGFVQVAIDLGRLPAGRHTVTLRPRPGLEVIGNGDPRAVSLVVAEPHVVEIVP